MSGALENVPGVVRLDIAANLPDFTVHYDAAQIGPEQIVELVAAKKEFARILR